VVVWLLVSRRSDAGADRMLADLTADIDRGGIADLGRAQAWETAARARQPADREPRPVGVRRHGTLAADYGVDTSRETADALAAHGDIRGVGPSVDGCVGHRRCGARAGTACTPATAKPPAPPGRGMRRGLQRICPIRCTRSGVFAPRNGDMPAPPARWKQR
jgi:hypothetical protein